MTGNEALKESVVRYCAALGEDPLLVQGPGGNVSWKDADTLWIKASGTWLAEAGKKDIFVPVDLAPLRTAMAAGDFGATARTVGTSPLRPSIETLLHALMPQRIVVHLHPIEILAHLVRADWEAEIRSAMGASTDWVCVPYRKPGAELAQALATALSMRDAARVVFLQNHGVVLGGSDVQEVDQTLRRLIAALQCAVLQPQQSGSPVAVPGLHSQGFTPIGDAQVHALATDPRLFSRLQSDWALYPDHVVFLGAFPQTYVSVTEAQDQLAKAEHKPDVLFIRDIGVFIGPKFEIAKQLQLRCYFDVMVRQSAQHRLHTLAHSQISELLNWDAEQYRASLSRK